MLADTWKTYEAAALEAGRQPDAGRLEGRPLDLPGRHHAGGPAAGADQLAGPELRVHRPAVRQGAGPADLQARPGHERRRLQPRLPDERADHRRRAPTRCCAACCALIEETGPFGTLVLMSYDWDDKASWLHSMELFSKELMPALNKAVAGVSETERCEEVGGRRRTSNASGTLRVPQSAAAGDGAARAHGRSASCPAPAARMAAAGPADRAGGPGRRFRGRGGRVALRPRGHRPVRRHVPLARHVQHPLPGRLQPGGHAVRALLRRADLHRLLPDPAGAAVLAALLHDAVPGAHLALHGIERGRAAGRGDDRAPAGRRRGPRGGVHRLRDHARQGARLRRLLRRVRAADLRRARSPRCSNA